MGFRLLADVSRRDPDHAFGPDRRVRSRLRPPSSSPLPSSPSSRWRCSRRRTSGSTLIEYVLPRACSTPRCCSAASAALSLAIGTGTAWTISLHEFRGRRMLLWLVPLPLAIPTYLAAYVYVDLFEPLGLVHRTLAVWLPLQDAVRLLPNLRSLPGADHRDRAGALPLRLSLGAHHVPVPERGVRRGREDARRRPLDHLLAHLAADGAAGARGRRRRWCRWKR